MAKKDMNGELLRTLRNNLGLTLESVAEQVGLSVSQINRFEREEREPRQSELFRLAKLYRVPIESLFGEEAGGGLVRHVQKLSWVSAGDWWLPEQIVEGDDLPTFPVSGLPEGDWAALRVEGSSMDRISPPGSTIILDRRDKRLVPNACYVIADEEGKATYKRYRPSPERFEPVTFSEGHDTIFPDGPVRIIGRVRRSMIDM